MRKLILSLTIVFAMPTFAQVITIRPAHNERGPILTPVAVRAEYTGAKLTNRGLYYINNQKHISHYFADEGDSELLLNSLSSDTQIKFTILQNDIKKYQDQFNTSLLKDLIDSAYESGHQDGAMATDLDALVKLVLGKAAREAAQDLSQILDEMEILNREKRKQYDLLEELKKKLADCMRTNTCPVRTRYALDIQIKAATQKESELARISDVMQLKLQAVFDRRTQVKQILSNLLKIISETTQSIVQDIK